MPTALPTLPDPSPPYGTPRTEADGIQRLVARNPGPFTFTGTSTYLVAGTAAVAIIDPGPDQADHVAAITQALGNRAERAKILITHTHRDHSPGAARLTERMSAPTYGFGPHGSGRPGGIDPKNSFESGDWDFVPDHALGQDHRVDLGGLSLVAHHMPGHCSNHLCFEEPDSGAVFCGDLVMSWSSSIVSPPDGDMAAYMHSLNHLKALKPVRLYPAHGVPIDEPEPFIDALIGHRLAREARVLDAVASGTKTLAELVPLVYSDVSKAAYPAAARSLLAHLIKLVDDGHLVADPAPTADAIFLPA